MEKTIVRNNLMNEKGYTPYCGNQSCKVMPRTVLKKDNNLGYQFHCQYCGWVSVFPKSFIKKYKEKWGLS